MPPTSSTIWTVIDEAASGDKAAREQFARSYLPAVSAYLGARWAGSRLSQRVDDAVQDVFIECFKQNGALDRVSRKETNSFRAYLFGMARNIARRYESGQTPEIASHKVSDQRISQIDPPADEPSLSHVFDRAWARSMMRQAGRRHADLAAQQGDEATRRLELLELRFQEGLPIRHIADLWNTDATKLHREYAKAREEFRQALTEVIRLHHDGSDVDVRDELRLILSLLS